MQKVNLFLLSNHSNVIVTPFWLYDTVVIMLSQIFVLDKFRLNLNLDFKNVFFTSHSETGKGQNYKNQNIKSWKEHQKFEQDQNVKSLF